MGVKAKVGSRAAFGSGCKSTLVVRFLECQLFKRETSKTMHLIEVSIPRESSVYNFGRNEFSLENGPNWKFSPGAKNLARGFFLMISNCLEFSPELEISPAV